MPTPTIPDGELFMNATLYTGTGVARSITNGNTGQSFQPDLVWIKSRNAVGDTEAYDSVRGTTKYLLTDSGNAEATGAQSLTAFNSDGFSLGTGAGVNSNTNGTTYVGWQWKAGGAAVTNTAGTISSQVSANTTSGFSVVTFTGNGSTGTVGHGLGVAPSMIIQKPRSSTGSWATYHASLGAGNAVWLNLTDNSASYPTVWNSTAPTSSVYSVGSYMGTATYVAYCWAPIAGYSAFGSYTGNGSTDGPFVYLGFRPRFIMIKRTDAVSDWWIWDTARNTFNQMQAVLYPNLSSVEVVDPVFNFDALSNGFKNRSSNSTVNGSGATYIYACFAENPFKYANAR